MGEADVSILTTKRPQSSQARPDLVSLCGRRIIMTAEPECSSSLKMGVVKQYTGGDKIMARQLYGTQMSFYLQGTWFMMCNDIPTIASSGVDDYGTWRRIVIFPFRSKFVYRTQEQHHVDEWGQQTADNEYLWPVDPTVDQKLESWKECFASLLLDHAGRQRVPEPKSLVAAREDVRAKTDVFSLFVKDKLIAVGAGVVSIQALFDAFRIWLSNANLPVGKKISREMFERYMRKILGTPKEAADGEGFPASAGSAEISIPSIVDPGAYQLTIRDISQQFYGQSEIFQVVGDLPFPDTVQYTDPDAVFWKLRKTRDDEIRDYKIRDNNVHPCLRSDPDIDCDLYYDLHCDLYYDLHCDLYCDLYYDLHTDCDLRFGLGCSSPSTSSSTGTSAGPGPSSSTGTSASTTTTEPILRLESSTTTASTESITTTVPTESITTTSTESITTTVPTESITTTSTKSITTTSTKSITTTSTESITTTSTKSITTTSTKSITTTAPTKSITTTAPTESITATSSPRTSNDVSRICSDIFESIYGKILVVFCLFYYNTNQLDVALTMVAIFTVLWHFMVAPGSAKCPVHAAEEAVV
ncbi:hypothetical protein HK102_004447 [Quaeritorhiza haematococci]|nr:hypothetical protein HK102_004447 [Quaeritorhiza haematococci]